MIMTGVTKRAAVCSDEESGEKENNGNLKKEMQEDGDTDAADDRQQVGSSAVNQETDVKMEDLSEVCGFWLFQLFAHNIQ